MVNIIIIKGLKFSLEDFREFDVPDLIINLWSYKWSQLTLQHMLPVFSLVQTNSEKKQKLKYGDFHFAIEKLKKNNRTLINVGNFSSTNKNDIIILLKQKNKMI